MIYFSMVADTLTALYPYQMHVSLPEFVIYIIIITAAKHPGKLVVNFTTGLNCKNVAILTGQLVEM